MQSFLPVNPSSKYRVSIILLTCSVLIGTNCQKAVESFSDMYVLRQELMKEFKAADINIVLQNTHLGISLLNSPFNDLGEPEKGMKAEEIALFAKNHYKSINTIDQIWVSFVVTKSFIFFHYSETAGVFRFETKDLQPLNTTSTAAPEKIVTSYNPDLNQVDVYLKKNLQLNGKFPGNVTLLPHFAIPCVGVAPRRAVPKSVILDFTTSSTKPVFRDHPQLTIYANRRQVFSGAVQNTDVMGSGSEKSVNEFLSQEISYSQFLEFTNGEKVRIALGVWEFELTQSQTEELQDLRKQAEEGKCR